MVNRPGLARRISVAVQKNDVAMHNEARYMNSINDAAGPTSEPEQARQKSQDRKK